MRRWGSKVESREVEKSREAIQNMKNTGEKKQENPHVLKNKQTPKILQKKKKSITLREDREVKQVGEKG